MSYSFKITTVSRYLRMQLMFLYVYLIYAHFALFSYIILINTLNHQLNNEQFIIPFLTSGPLSCCS